MKLVVIVLNKLDCLDKLLTAFGKNSIPGATILSSRGMAQTLEAHDELRFIGSLRMLMNANYKENRTMKRSTPSLSWSTRPPAASISPIPAFSLPCRSTGWKG